MRARRRRHHRHQASGSSARRRRATQVAHNDAPLFAAIPSTDSAPLLSQSDPAICSSSLLIPLSIYRSIYLSDLRRLYLISGLATQAWPGGIIAQHIIYLSHLSSVCQTTVINCRLSNCSCGDQTALLRYRSRLMRYYDIAAKRTGRQAQITIGFTILPAQALYIIGI